MSTRRRGKKFVTPAVMISERPAEVDDRAVTGHGEDDLIGDQPEVKNEPALSGHGAEAVRDAIAASITTLPDRLRRSRTWNHSRWIFLRFTTQPFSRTAPSASR